MIIVVLPARIQSYNSLVIFLTLSHMHSVTHTYFHKGDLEAYLSPENY